MKLVSNVRSIAMYTAWDLTYLTKSRTEKRVQGINTSATNHFMASGSKQWYVFHSTNNSDANKSMNSGEYALLEGWECTAQLISS